MGLLKKENNMRKLLFFTGILFLISMPVKANESPYTITASWYKYGKVTANGEKFNANVCTAAHKYLPFGTILRVYNPKTNKSIIVRINDRGPYIKGRQLDVSLSCAKKLGMVKTGVTELKIQVIS